MKRKRVVQSIKNELKGAGRQSQQQLMDNIKRALRRRGIKEKT